jgi:O-antigen ligase
VRLDLDLTQVAIRLALVGTALVVGVLAGVNPAFGVAAALGLAFTLLVLADLTAGVCLFGFMIFIEVLPQAGSLSLFKALGLLLALSWVAAAAAPQHTDSLFSARPLVGWLVIGFLAWAALSLAWSESTSTAFTALSRYVFNLALFPIVWTAIRTRRDALWLLAALVAGATVAAIAGIIQPPSPSNEGFESASRATGTIGDPNQFAAVLVVGICLAATVVLAPRSGLARVAAAGGAGLCALGIFLSLSRGGLIALACAIMAAVVMGGRWRGVIAAIALAVVLSTVLYFSMFASLPARERITTVQQGGGSGRTSLWTVGWRMVEAHPVRGVGVGQFPVSSAHFLLRPGAIRRDDKIIGHPDVAHNTYLQIQTELGLVGFLIFLGIIVTSLTSLARAASEFRRRGDESMEIVARGLFVGLVGLLAADFFISEMYSKLLWLLLALGPVLLGIALRSVPEARTVPRPRFARKLVAA